MVDFEGNDLPSTTSGLLRRMAGELVCPICLSYYDEPVSTPCLHTYCKACILKSLENLALCPLCKFRLTKRQLNPMPAIADIVANFHELQAAYEEESGQILSQEPIHSSQWQFQPDQHLTQKYPYPVKDQDINTKNLPAVHNGPVVNESTSAALDNQNMEDTTIIARQAEEDYGGLSHLNGNYAQVEGSVDEEEDDDATQIPLSQINNIYTASSPDLPNQIYSLAPEHSNESLRIHDTYQSSEISIETGTEPSPNFWKESIRRDSTSAVSPYVILGTRLPHSLSQQEFKRVVERLQGKVVDSFSQDVTHIVTTVDDKKLARRTLKYLQGIVCGKWILDGSWLEKSIHAGNFVTEDEYEVLGDEASDRLSVPRIARQTRNANKEQLFSGLEIVLSGTFYGPTNEDLVALISYGGGVIIEATENLPETVVIVRDVRDNNIPHYTGFREVINAAWILDSISCYRQLPMAQYRA